MNGSAIAEQPDEAEQSFRTMLAPVPLTRDGSVTLKPESPVDAIGGNVITTDRATYGEHLAFGADKLQVMVSNDDDMTHTCVVRGGTFAIGRTMQDDLIVPVAAGTTRLIGPFTRHRFAQGDGSVWLDWDSPTGMNVAVYQWPQGS